MAYLPVLQHYVIKSYETAVSPFTFCERVPNYKRRENEKSEYKKGYEIRISLKDIEEIRKIKAILNGKEIGTGKPYGKNKRMVLPIYGFKNTEEFRKTIKKIENKAL
jgi:hypothetical protein